MKKLAYVLTLTGLVSVPMLASAEDSPHTLSANVGFTTDYIFRGVSQSQHEPAVQGGFDYSHASGIYVGTWASNVSWVKESGLKDNNSMEIDLYGGYKGSLSDDLGYDVGIVTYYYPGDKVGGATTPNTTEVYAGVSWKSLSLKYSYVVSDYFVAWTTTDGDKTRGSYYLDLSATHDLGSGWGVLGHVGYQDVKDNDDASYTDWKIGVTKNVGFGTFTLAYTDTNADVPAYTWGLDSPTKVAKGRVALSFNKSF